MPAITVPIGYDAKGLPIGLQLIGRWWEEHTLIRLALIIERAIQRRKPQNYYDVLGEARTSSIHAYIPVTSQSSPDPKRQRAGVQLNVQARME